MQQNAFVFKDTKPHYELLDGLRGVAALLVIWYHVFEGFATSPADQRFNHGYLAVDFFFILSGFVIGYAYDDRWKGRMTTKGFFMRRLIRLHPMVIIGIILGTISFILQGCVQWDGTSVSPLWIMAAMMMTIFMLPAIPGTGPDIRGYGEMFPLNGPQWSLFFEYLGNLTYALAIRRMSTKALKVLVAVCGAGLAAYSIFNLSGFHNLGVGWTLAGYNFPGGLLRMMFSFPMGLLMSRNFRPRKIKGAFWICSAALALLLSMPYACGTGLPWVNGIYDAICTVLMFPLLVYIGASGTADGKATSGICRFLGDISYPVYIIHYPFMYYFYSWVWKNGIAFSQAWPFAVGIFICSIALSYIFLKLYDEPVRKWLSKRFL
ncbi:MAG: acyltransferase [Clostridium sp.]|nr:acyltransferase [Bacteroides sp.]MCM1198987.1 acyltransferase [Clostridium sp.]